MKSRLLLSALVLMLTSVLFTGCVLRLDNEATKIKVYNPTGEHDTLPSDITANAGEEFIIKLQSNPTTGYTWKITIADESILHLDDEDFVVDDPDATGSGGMGTYTFSAKKKGQTTLTLELGRHWEGGEKDKSITINVTVK